MRSRLLVISLVIACVAGASSAARGEDPQQRETAPAENVAQLLEIVQHGKGQSRLDALEYVEQAALHNRLGEHKLDVIERCADLLDDPSADLANAACDVLAWLDEDAAPALVRVMQSNNADAQSRAALALSSIASRSKADLEKLDIAIPHLAKLLDGGPKSARHNAFYAISALGPKAIPYMIEQLDAEDYFQEVMRKGFVRHGEKAVEPLSEALRDGKATTRRNAARMLFFLSWQAPEALPAIERKALGSLTAAVDDKDPLVREAALDTLGRMGVRAKPALPTIFAALARDDALFISIAEAIRGIGPEAKHLAALLTAPDRVGPAVDPDRAISAFGAAAAAAGEVAVQPSIAALEVDGERVPKTAMYALFYLGPKAAPAISKLIERLDDGDPFAAQILGAIGPAAKEAVPHLIRRLADGEWGRPRSGFAIYHRSVYANALAAIGAPALPAVLKGLEHEDALVRAGCLVALEHMERDVMVPVSAIKPLLDDKHPVIRGQALLALVKHADAETLKPILERLRDDPHRGVARNARRYLDELETSQK